MSFIVKTKASYNIRQNYIHPSIHYLDRLSGAGSRWQLAKQGPPGFLLPSHALQFLLGDPGLRLSPATLRRKLISAACTRDLILSVTTQSS